MECKTCFCNRLRECPNCNCNGNKEKDKCKVEPGRYCTCRLCGFAVRSDGYSGRYLYEGNK